MQEVTSPNQFMTISHWYMIDIMIYILRWDKKNIYFCVSSKSKNLLGKLVGQIMLNSSVLVLVIFVQDKSTNKSTND